MHAGRRTNQIRAILVGMRLESVLPEHPELVLAARAMFGEYENWLRTTKSCGSNYPVLDDEIISMPAAYADRAGEVLLALINNEPAACIAWRSTAEPGSFEIKRLFVRPAFRGQGLARMLILEAMRRIGPCRIVLDTDTSTMPGAHALYLSLGFREYRPRRGSLADLERLP
jgi:GNAT superfamily N-acetyltransferase